MGFLSFLILAFFISIQFIEPTKISEVEKLEQDKDFLALLVEEKIQLSHLAQGYELRGNCQAAENQSTEIEWRLVNEKNRDSVMQGLSYAGTGKLQRDSVIYSNDAFTRVKL